MAMRYSIDRIAYTVLSSVNFAAPTPASRIADLVHPRRVARSADTAVTQMILELGATPQALNAISFDNVNFSQVDLHVSNTSPTNPAIRLPGSPYTIGLDHEDGRRKLVVPLTGTAYRWLRIRPQSPISGESTFDLGGIGCWSTFPTFARNLGAPYSKTLQVASRTIEFGTGGREVQSPGTSTLGIATSAMTIVRNSAAHVQFAVLARLPCSQVILLFENEGDTGKVYHVRGLGPWTISRNASGFVDVSARLAEVL